jgi:hypothetical protein
VNLHKTLQIAWAFCTELTGGEHETEKMKLISWLAIDDGVLDRLDYTYGIQFDWEQRPLSR